MNDKIRVLHVLDILTSNGGVANVVLNYVRQSNKSNYIIDIVINKESDKNLIDEVESYGGRVFLLPEIKITSFLNFQREFAKILSQNDYKIVHGHLANSIFLYMKEAKELNIPVRIIHSHSILNSSSAIKRIRNGILNKAIPFNCTHFFACSKQAGINLFKRFANIDDVSILPNSIDTNKFKYNKQTRMDLRKLHNVEDCFVIGHIGRFSKEKNHKFLINTFQKLLQNNQKCKLILIGDGELKVEIQKFIHERKIEEYVLMLGVKENVYDYYQMFDCLWFPSLFEGFGIVALEAQCSGLPCIVSNNVPRSVAVTDLISFIELNDTEKWLEVTKNYINTKFERLDKSLVIRNIGYDVIDQGEKLFLLYDKILKEVYYGE